MVPAFLCPHLGARHNRNNQCMHIRKRSAGAARGQNAIKCGHRCARACHGRAPCLTANLDLKACWLHLRNQTYTSIASDAMRGLVSMEYVGWPAWGQSFLWQPLRPMELILGSTAIPGVEQSLDHKLMALRLWIRHLEPHRQRAGSALLTMP